VENIVDSMFERFVTSQLSSPEQLLNFMKLRFETTLGSIQELCFINNSHGSINEQFWHFLSSHSYNILRLLGSSITEEDISSILIKKHCDYGPENISKFGEVGIIVRLYDKISRLENLLKNSNNNFNTAMNIHSVKDESLIDTLVDIIGYSVIGIMMNSFDEDGRRVFDYPMK
jgi:hypothetical protein